MAVKKQGTEFAVPNVQNRYEFDPSVTALSDGRALVTWTEAGLRLRSGEYPRPIHARPSHSDGPPPRDEIATLRHRYPHTH